MKKAALILFLLALGFGVGYACAWMRIGSVTLVSVSPGDGFRVRLLENQRDFIDRTFVVEVQSRDYSDPDRDGPNVIFRSPDEGGPPGSERVVWSKDGARFLLVGRHFAAPTAPTLATGEIVYLMYDRRTRDVWCNSDQQKTYPHFSLDDLKGREWIGLDLSRP
ncbi:MAG TPA: hypothetical protein VGF55_03670 [Gemmataceae bacterium]